MPTSKPLRAWIAASGADQIVIDPYGGWNEPTNRAAAILRADPTELASGWAARLEGLEGRERPLPERWTEAERGGAGGARRGTRGDGEITEPGPAPRPRRRPPRRRPRLHRPRACRSATRRPSSPPATPTSSSSPTAAPTASTASISSGIGAAQASGRPTTIVTGDLGLLHDLGGLAALRDVETPVRIVVIDNDGGGIFHFLPQESALDSEEFEALLGTPRGVDVAKAAALFDLPHRRLESLADLPDALAAGTGLIEVKTDRRANVEAHRHLAAAPSACRESAADRPASRPGPGCQAAP